MAQPGLKVKNLAKLHRALKDYDQGLKLQLEQELREAGEIVATSAQQRFSLVDAKSAAGIKSKTRGFGRVLVVQTRRKTTGQHPEFGSMIMRRGLVPAVSDNRERIVAQLENMLDRLGGDFN